MKSLDEINVSLPLSIEDFITIFNHIQVPLTPEEKDRVKNEYFQMYTLFLINETVPETAFIAIKNLFALKESQIGARIGAEKILKHSTYGK
jgi:hypothetical protein